MLKNMKYFILFFSLIILSNCSNDFVLIDQWKNIPIVYGVLSSSEATNYIRVEKAFIDQSQDAFTLAQRPDSLYYDNITVKLQNEDTGREINLERINVEDIGVEREEGIFATTPNILYRFNNSDFPLQEDQIIKLSIIDGSTEEVLTEATTAIVGQYEISESTPTNPLQFKYDTDFSISWRSDEKQAAVYDVFMKINYEEQNPDNTSEWFEKELLWVLDQNIEREVSGTVLVPRTTFSVSGRKFYEFLAQNIDESVQTIRVLNDIDVIIDAGGQELFNYIDVGSANTGITSNQIINTYTNLSNGLGVFSSKTRVQRFSYNLHAITRDSLREGIITSSLNFQ